MFAQNTLHCSKYDSAAEPTLVLLRRVRPDRQAPFTDTTTCISLCVATKVTSNIFLFANDGPELPP